MALSEEDKKEMVSLMAEGMAAGLTKFRSDTEEAAAKAQALKQEEDAKKEGTKGGGGNDKGNDGFSFGRFLLGG